MSVHNFYENVLLGAPHIFFHTSLTTRYAPPQSRFLARPVTPYWLQQVIVAIFDTCGTTRENNTRKYRMVLSTRYAPPQSRFLARPVTTSHRCNLRHYSIQIQTGGIFELDLIILPKKMAIIIPPIPTVTEKITNKKASWGNARLGSPLMFTQAAGKQIDGVVLQIACHNHPHECLKPPPLK